MGKGKLAKRRRAEPQARRVPERQPRPATQILLLRVRQGCYGICTGAFVAIPAAMLGEHSPTHRMVMVIVALALFAGITGLLVEIVEHRIFPEGKDET